MVDKVIRDGKVAVLISPGYGIGWSTSVPTKLREILLFDKRFVEACEAQVIDIDPLTEVVLGDCFDFNYYSDFYSGGWCNVEIVWLDEGTQFAVLEYDGCETVALIKDLTITA